MAARYLPWLALVWTLGITLRYVSTVWKSVNHPFLPGDDVFMFRLWLALAAGALFALIVLNRLSAFRVIAAVLTAAVFSIVVLSGSLIPMILTLWLLAVVLLLGDDVLRWVRSDEFEDLSDRVVIALPIGLTCLGLISLLMALLGLFNPEAAWVTLLAMTFLQGRRALEWLRDLRSRLASGAPSIIHTIPEAAILLAMAGIVFFANVMWSVAPEVQYDTLNVRLAVPRIYVQEGRFVDLPYIFHSYFVRLIEFVYGFCLALHSEAVAKLLNAGIGLASALSVYCLGRSLFTPAIGLWAAVLFYTTPLVSWVAGTAYTDLSVSLFATALILVFIFWHRTRRSGWLTAAGLLAGAAVSVKLTAAVVILSVGAALAVSIYRSKESIRWKLRSLDAFLTIAALAALPWHLVTFALTGNPIFPLMNGIFRSPKWELSNTSFNLADFGVGISPSAILRLPFRLALDTSRFGEALPAGALGPLMLLFVPLGILFLFKMRGETRIAGIVTLMSLGFWALTFQYGRYYLAILPGVSVFAVAGLHWALPGDMRRYVFAPVLGLLLIVQVSVLPVLFWNIPERLPVGVATGREDRKTFLRRSLAGYGAAEHLNASVAAGDRVLAIGFENVRFYLNPPMESLSEVLLDADLHQVAGLTGRHLARVLAGLGFSHILLSPSDLQKPRPEYLYVSADFLRDFAVLEYSDVTARVYRLNY